MTQCLGEAIRRGMVARRILDGVVRNVFASDVGKLAAWTSASHIEKAPKSQPATPYLVEYDDADAREMAHYMLRWRMSDGSASAWGETLTATITG